MWLLRESVCVVVVALLLESERETLKTHLHQLEIGYKKAVNDHLASLTKHQRIRHIKVRCEKKLNSISRRREFLSLGSLARALPLTQTAGIKLYEQLISIIGADSDYNIISLERVCVCVRVKYYFD